MNDIYYSYTSASFSFQFIGDEAWESSAIQYRQSRLVSTFAMPELYEVGTSGNSSSGK